MKWLISGALICISIVVNAQVCLDGIVSDRSTSEVIYNAVIYLPEQQLLTRSDEKGHYSFCDIPTGNVTLQVRAFGYRSEIISIQVTDSLNSFNLQLTPSNQEYPEVVIYGDRLSKLEETPNEIDTYSTEEMRNAGALTLSDGIAKYPGVSQLSTGAGISKPVIRGLYGNRIQTIMLGLRFDNQQWQDEHGLGLSDVGVDRVEIIKGPSSLLYGPEAMGGVLNIIEEKPAPVGKISVDVSTRFFSNTYGIATDLGIKGAKKRVNWRLRAGVESHADYTDGNNDRVINTRFGGYYLKSSFGYRGKRWISQNNYFFSMNNFGFIMEGGVAFYEADGRQSRTYQLPHHSVYLNVLSSQNTFYMKGSKLKVNLGAQINDRQEQEGGNKISLNMLLSTITANVLWEKQLTPHMELNIGTQELYQNNKNIGSRMIVPDADVAEASGFAYLKNKWKYLVIEGGVRYGLKNISTYPTGELNIGNDNPGADVLTFNNWYSSLNGALGISLFDGKHWNVKANFSSGYRPGNLAELSSNGLHEGTIRYEIGNTGLKTERNVCADIYAGFESKHLSLTWSGYINRFFDYIYLAPTDDEYIGFQIFRYVQKDAMLKGMESVIDIHPEQWRWLNLRSTYSTVIGTTSDGENLPFIPANKLNAEIKFQLEKVRTAKKSFVKFGSQYVFEQSRPGQFETSTDDYWLFDAAIGTSFGKGQRLFTVSLAATNLLNNTYYSHLSRYKYFGIYNMGRNIVLNLKYKF